MQKLMVISVILASVLLTGCGLSSEVPPAYYGKILTKNGYKPDLITPKSLRLAPCFPGQICEKLILIQASDVGGIEAFQAKSTQNSQGQPVQQGGIYMPRSELNIQLDVRFIYTVNRNRIDHILDRVAPTRITEKGRVKEITSQSVYNTYVKQILRDVVRTVVTQYTIEEVASSREAINAKLFEKVTEALAGTPVIMKRFALADVQFPSIITEAKERAAERREAIEQERAQFEIEKVKLEGELQKAKLQRAVQREKAQAEAEVNAIISESVTADYRAYKALDIAEKIATNANGNTVFFPASAIDEIGLNTRIFGAQK